METGAEGFRRRLLGWYGESARRLPWRESTELWPVLVSEFMLQQTRVESVLRFFGRFLERFPVPRALAEAEEAEVLAAWSGLGYYSRARNLRRAAAAMEARWPATYEEVRELPGVGAYTAAAVSSIALDLRHAAVDGNVLRVIARVTGDAGDIAEGKTRARFEKVAQGLLDGDRPGDFNQAMMELGATICLPRGPRCVVCPVAGDCVARRQGRQDELPVKRRKPAATLAECGVVVVWRGGRILLRQRAATEPRMAGFWELPVAADFGPAARLEPVQRFRHTIVNTRFEVTVFEAGRVRAPRGGRWFAPVELERIPLTTIARKALAGRAEARLL